MRTRALATVITLLLVTATVTLVVRGDGSEDGGELATAPSSTASPTSTTSTTVAPTTTTTPPPPPRIWFSAGAAGVEPALRSMAGDGRSERAEPGRAVRLDQMSPGRDRIVYAKAQPTGKYDSQGAVVGSGLYVANRDGSNETVLTSGGYDTEPTWSPKGELIAYVRHTQRGTEQYDTIGFVRPNGEVLATLDTPRGEDDGSPRFSPDGSRLALMRYGDAGPVLSVADLATGQVKPVRTGQFHSVTWSPDGTRLAAVGSTSGEHYGTQLWVMPVDGGTGRPVFTLRSLPNETRYFCSSTVNGFAQVRAPAWSPDGATIAFTHNGNHLTEDDLLFDIAAVGADGRGLRTLRRSPPPRCDPTTGHRIFDDVAVLGWGHA